MGGTATRTRYGQSLGYEPTGMETIMHGLGLRSGRSQEMGDLRRAESRDLKKMTEERNKAYAMYVHAPTTGEKAIIRQQINEGFNTRWADNRITTGDLFKAEERYRKGLREMEEHPEYAGLTLSSKEKSLTSRFSAYMPT